MSDTSYAARFAKQNNIKTMTNNPCDVTPEKPLNHRVVVGRRRRAKTESKVLEAALHVFAEKGPSAPVIDDFIKAAGIARGTFYNYFKSTDELLQATSAWLSDELSASIEKEIFHLKDPELRHCTAMRLWMTKAESDPAWCAFISKIWFEGGITHRFATRDLRLGIKKGVFQCANEIVGFDISLGTMRQAMLRLAEGKKQKGYSEIVVRQIFVGLGVAPEKIDELMSHPLNAMNIDSHTLK
ncbi:MAG TPA: TetR/AcrR family transcriptional regulator [Noviherbaspirillum sp.]|nr:TetR/AcrR family transcriptional regulator [Noviherbaspirillum sp.]